MYLTTFVFYSMSPKSNYRYTVSYIVHNYIVNLECKQIGLHFHRSTFFHVDDKYLLVYLLFMSMSSTQIQTQTFYLPSASPGVCYLQKRPCHFVADTYFFLHSKGHSTAVHSNTWNKLVISRFMHNMSNGLTLTS